VILTEWEGQSPDLVESQITAPISSALLGAPRVQFVRGQSMFGLSFVYVIFDEGTDLYWARSRVLEYLSSVRGTLPDGAEPMLGPDATSVGWVFQYALVDESGQQDLQSLRAYQDWTLRYALASVPGVAEVASVGGIVKQFQIQVDPMRLVANGVTLDAVIAAVRASNEDAGGSVLGHRRTGARDPGPRARALARRPAQHRRDVAVRRHARAPRSDRGGGVRARGASRRSSTSTARVRSRAASS
jgi:Cu(I)/Ag(I) efflux system membrane protein CusA/SilA